MQMEGIKRRTSAYVNARVNCHSRFSIVGTRRFSPPWKHQAQQWRPSVLVSGRGEVKAKMMVNGHPLALGPSIAPISTTFAWYWVGVWVSGWGRRGLKANEPAAVRPQCEPFLYPVNIIAIQHCVTRLWDGMNAPEPSAQSYGHLHAWCERFSHEDP